MSCCNKAELGWSPLGQSQTTCNQQSHFFVQMEASREGFSWMIWDNSEDHLGKDYKGIFRIVLASLVFQQVFKLLEETQKCFGKHTTFLICNSAAIPKFRVTFRDKEVRKEKHLFLCEVGGRQRGRTAMCSDVSPWARQSRIQKKADFHHTPSRGEALMLDARLVPYVRRSRTDLNIRNFRQP